VARVEAKASELRARPHGAGCPVRGADTDGFRSTMDIELFQEVVHVVLDRCHFDSEASSDLLVREILVNEPNNLSLAAGQVRG